MARVKIYPQTMEATTEMEKTKFSRWQLFKMLFDCWVGSDGAFYYKGDTYYIYKVNKSKVEYFAEAEEESDGSQNQT